jgi:tetratricopeptide (TPR) repeat protein
MNMCKRRTTSPLWPSLSFRLAIAIIAAAAIPAAAQNPSLTDFGQVSFANSGSPAAQQAFLRGLGALHDFEFATAAAGFRQAQQIDPNFAMAYWGEAMSQNDGIHFQQNTEAGRAALHKLGPTLAARLAKCPTERERDYLRAVDALYNAPGTKNERDFKYAAAMAALYEKYPTDVDAGALYALSLLGTAHGGRDFSIYMKSLAVLEPLFFAHPDHPGVDHYLIHSVDDPIHAPLGLAAARNYSQVALQAPHAQHMTSHIFVAMGMWDDVVRANVTASGVLNEQNAQNHKPATVCGHYNLWLEYGHLQQGRARDARKDLDACRAAAIAPAPAAANASAMPGMPMPASVSMPAMAPTGTAQLGAYAQMRLRYLLDTDEWDGEVARWPLPAGADAGVRLSFTFADGYGAVRRGDLPAARQALGAISSPEMSGGARGVGTGAATAASYQGRAAILQQELAAMIASAEGQRDEAIAQLRQAAEAENAMPFEYGPPFIDKPTEELLGETLLDAQKPKEAAEAFQRSLTRTPQRTQSLLGLQRAQKAAGDTVAAQQTATKLKGIWHGADAMPRELQ